MLSFGVGGEIVEGEQIGGEKIEMRLVERNCPSTDHGRQLWSNE